MEKKSKQHIIKFSQSSLGIRILGCGWSYRNYSHPIQKRNWIRSNNLIVFFLEGKGKLESAGTGLVELKPGDIFTIPKDVWHRYGPELEEEWLEFWISFEGSNVKWLWKQAFNGGYELDQCRRFHIKTDEKLIELFEAFFTMSEKEDYKKCTALFLEIMQVIEASQKDNRQLQKFPYITSIIEKIDNNPILSIDFEEEATRLGISYALLRKEFLKHTGMPPYKYLLNHRMQYACNLLADKRSVKETCYEVGMKDPSHFSKLFKKVIGMSPIEFASKLEPATMS